MLDVCIWNNSRNAFILSYRQKEYLAFRNGVNTNFYSMNLSCAFD